MRRQPGNLRKQQGMTLVEVMVTITVLSFVLGSSLTLYASMLKNIKKRDSVITMLHDADRIMTTLGTDIRRADKWLNNYSTRESYTVIAAMKVTNPFPNSSQEYIVVYALDDAYPNRLVRTVYAGESTTSTALSTRISAIKITPKPRNLVNVELLLEETVAGETKSWQGSSAFALMASALER